MSCVFVLSCPHFLYVCQYIPGQVKVTFILPCILSISLEKPVNVKMKYGVALRQWSLREWRLQLTPTVLQIMLNCGVKSCCCILFSNSKAITKNITGKIRDMNCSGVSGQWKPLSFIKAVHEPVGLILCVYSFLLVLDSFQLSL